MSEDFARFFPRETLTSVTTYGLSASRFVACVPKGLSRIQELTIARRAVDHVLPLSVILKVIHLRGTTR
jgi:hypothetical protein